MKKYGYFIKYILLACWILASSCESDSNENTYASQYNYVDCVEVKSEFINYVNENIDEILSIIDREIKIEEGNDEITSQRLLDAFQTIRFTSQWEEYENILMTNCPHIHEEFQTEISLLILTEILRKYGSELNQ
jgi:hypothetical protein